MLDVILKRFEQPDETMTFEKRFRTHVGGRGRAMREPDGAGRSTSAKRAVRRYGDSYVGIVVPQPGSLLEKTAR